MSALAICTHDDALSFAAPLLCPCLLDDTPFSEFSEQEKIEVAT